MWFVAFVPPCIVILVIALKVAYDLTWERGYFAGRDLENKNWQGNCVVQGYGHWANGEWGKDFRWGLKQEPTHERS